MLQLWPKKRFLVCCILGSQRKVTDARYQHYMVVNTLIDLSCFDVVYKRQELRNKFKWLDVEFVSHANPYSASEDGTEH